MLKEILSILLYTQDELMDKVIQYENIVDYEPNKYAIWSMNSTPKPMLCIHLDTINTMSNKGELSWGDLVVKDDESIISINPSSKVSCLGADDRAGVWVAFKLIEWMLDTGVYPYDIGFFCDEEVGGIGSSAYRREGYVLGTTAYIGLDRRSGNGKQEVATYGTTNSKLLKLFTDLGYSHEMGSFTDASNLASEDVSCLNLSVGYDNEHTKREVLYLDCMKETLAVLKGIHIPNEAYIVDEVDEYSYKYELEDYYNDYDRLDSLEDEIRDLKAELQEMAYEIIKLKEGMLGL